MLLPLDQLEAHPANANAMPAARLAKLQAHIQSNGRYPPLIVRPLAPQRYQILDGHHRAAALRALGHDGAQCEVWDVNDAQALLLLATLNRLQGRDDPHKRAALVESLCSQSNLAHLARFLPESCADLKHLLTLRQPPPPPQPAQPLGQIPEPVHFFLLPADRQRLEACLRRLGPTREQALLALLPDRP